MTVPRCLGLAAGGYMNVADRPILLKKSISADGPKILALIPREARVDAEDRKELLTSRPSVL